MESEKVKKIKKVIEMFAIDNKEMTLFQSPVPQGESCEITIKYADILTLINDLERANERLKDSNKNILFVNEHVIKQNDDLTKENQQLKNRIATLEYKLDAKESYYNAVKDRALEVFVQKIEAEIPDESTFGYLGYNGVKEVIDEKLKECLGK